MSITGAPLNILSVMIMDFDRVVRAFEKASGMTLAPPVTRAMLRDYLALRGYLYTSSSPWNTPLMFAYMASPQKLSSQRIHDESLISAIKMHVPAASFSPQNKLKAAKPDTIKSRFSRHRMLSQRPSIEVLTMEIFDERDDSLFLSREIEFDTSAFAASVNENAPKRDQKRLALALTLLNEHDPDLADAIKMTKLLGKRFSYISPS